MVQHLDLSLAGDEAFSGILDMSVMEQLLSLDDGAFGLLEEMLALYQEDTPDRIVAIEHTLGSGELADMADVAHAIKGAASTIGVMQVRTLAAELEGGGRAGAFNRDPKAILGELKEAYDESCAALGGYIKRYKTEE